MDGDDDDTQNVYAFLYICSHLMVTFTCTCHMLSKIYSISSTAIFLAKRIAAMTYGVNQVKKVRNILTRVQLSVVYEGPCSTEPVNTFKKRRRALSCILNKAGMGKNYIMQNNIQGYQQYHLLNVSLITIPSFRLVHIKKHLQYYKTLL